MDIDDLRIRLALAQLRDVRPTDERLVARPGENAGIDRAVGDEPVERVVDRVRVNVILINAETGQAATDADTNTVFEIFRKENVPAVAGSVPAELPVSGDDAAAIPEQLF